MPAVVVAAPAPIFVDTSQGTPGNPSPTGGVMTVQGVTGAVEIPVVSNDNTATGALGALNANVSILLAGTTSAGFQLAAGTLIGTIVPEISFDGGTTWNQTYFDFTSTSSKVSSITFSSSNTATAATIVGAGGAGLARVRVSAYTSGTANITIRSSQINDPSVLFSGPTGAANPPTMAMVGGSDGANLVGLRMKDANTPAVAADPALVVAVSPNNSVAITLPPDASPATQNITAQDVGSTTTVGANNQLIITGSSTAGSTASFAVSTQETVQVQVTGSWTGALQTEVSPDNGTTWYLRRPYQAGASLPQSTEFTANFVGGINVAGFTNIRVRSVASWTGTATVRVNESANSNIVYISTATPIEVIPAIQRADAFHRLRMSQPVRQWSSMSEYPDFPFLWETAVVGTGSVTWEQYLSSQRLSTGGTGSTASAIRQTRRYMRYQPGKSTLILMTFVMSAAQTNSVAEIGYYDASNGIFFQRNGTTLNVVRRTNVTGTPTDNIVAQSSWNLDRLDGTGPSGVTLDPTKAQILIIDLQWLGVGTARIGFDFGGVIGPVWCHQFVNQNTLTSVYMSTGSLPLRGRVANTGTAGGTVTLDMICTAYANEGASQGRGVLDTDRVSTFSIGNGPTLRATSYTGTPIMSIRAATQYGGTGSGGQPNRGWIVPISATVYASSVDCYYEIWAGGALTGASWTAFGANSITDYDVSATSFSTTGGFLVVNGYVSSTKNAGTGGQFLTPYEIPLVYSGLNSVQDSVTMLVFSLSTGSNATGATVTWEERY